MTVINSIANRADELKGWRRELHQHPEICYEEVWTSDFVAAKLESFGVSVSEFGRVEGRPREEKAARS